MRSGEVFRPREVEEVLGRFRTCEFSTNQQPSDTADSAKVKWDEWTALMGGKPAAMSHTFVGFNT